MSVSPRHCQLAGCTGRNPTVDSPSPVGWAGAVTGNACADPAFGTTTMWTGSTAGRTSLMRWNDGSTRPSRCRANPLPGWRSRSMTKAESIRAHVHAQYIEPARRRGDETVTVVAGAALRDLQLRGDYAPSVCSALRARRLSAENDLELIRVDGPRLKQSTTTAFTYRLPQRSETGHPPRRPATRSGTCAVSEETCSLRFGGGDVGSERKGRRSTEPGRECPAPAG